MGNTPQEVQALFLPLYADLRPEDQFDIIKPLLAHYTSLEVLESIARNDEIWFSNPLVMNDLEEVRFGVNVGYNAARNSIALRTALGTTARHDIYLHALDHYYSEFENNHAFDTYVFCASVHNPLNTDGLLSMWRGYGGNGHGAAIVFDTAKMNLVPPPTPLILAKVRYETGVHRAQYLDALCGQAAHIVSLNSIPDNLLYLVAYSLFDRFKLFALFTKHAGFLEEQEWRAVYRREIDTEKKFDQMFGYSIGPNGIEPRLKFKLRPIPGLTSDDLSLEKLVHSIILGPTNSSVMAQNSVKRMLQLTGKPELADRVIASTIPLRRK